MSELKPCPCGGKVHIERATHESGIVCLECGERYCWGYYQNDDELLAKEWNTRKEASDE